MRKILSLAFALCAAIQAFGAGGVVPSGGSVTTNQLANKTFYGSTNKFTGVNPTNEFYFGGITFSEVEPAFVINNVPIMAFRQDGSARALYFGHIDATDDRIVDAIVFNASFNGTSPRLGFTTQDSGGQKNGFFLYSTNANIFSLSAFDGDGGGGSFITGEGHFFRLVNGVFLHGNSVYPQHFDAPLSTGLEFRYGTVTNLIPSAAIWRQTGTRVITNTTSAVTFFSGAGTTNLPASFLNTVGRTIRINFRGRYSTAGTPGNFTLDVALGGTTIITTGSQSLTAFAANTEKYFELDAYLTTRTTGASGTVMGAGRLDLHSSTATLNMFPLLIASPVTVDLTAAQALHVRGTMSASTAPNNWQIQEGSVYVE